MTRRILYRPIVDEQEHIAQYNAISSSAQEIRCEKNYGPLSEYGFHNVRSGTNYYSNSMIDHPLSD